MKKDENFKELPKTVKFTNSYTENKEEFIIEYLIAELIHNGYSIDDLLEPFNAIQNKKMKEGIKTKTINIVLDFINLNPQYIYVLKQDGNDELLFFLDVDFIA